MRNSETCSCTQVRCAKRALKALIWWRGVAGGGGQEQDARLAGAGEGEDIVVQQRVVGLHREAAAAHREDGALLERDGGTFAHAATGSAAPRAGAAALESSAALGRLGASTRRAQVVDLQALSRTCLLWSWTGMRGRRDASSRHAPCGCPGSAAPRRHRRRSRRTCRRRRAVILGSPCGLRVVVDAVGVGQQPQSAHGTGRAVEGAQRLLEPAQRAGGGSAQDDPPAPGLAQDGVQAVRTPRAEHATGRCRHRRRSGPGRAGAWQGHPRPRRCPDRDGTETRGSLRSS